MTTVNPTTGSLPVPSLNRPVAVGGAVLTALVVNLVIWLIGAAAGGDFTTIDGDKTQDVAPGGVIVLSTVPLLIGLGAAALLSYRWIVVLRVAAAIGSVLALATIFGTIAADFDTASTVSLALMHVALVPILIISTEGLRKYLTQG
ncbi:DUF6069 family protein [Nocardia bovistercoris]|uniref:Uncharacterized protein n=1 Tax=Nocardia bovistercoris TaxID=2785916 RepID=A0A931IFW7_9NOCA|nr:DUF6069 family protein [Nocardia bovistercoris]MBH0780581.1 hypothetical protein [Nocardia bovistercoris]